MRIAYVTSFDPHDPGIWAGTGFHIGRAMQEQGCEVDFIGPLSERRALYFKAKTYLYRKWKKQAFQRDREPAILDGYADQINEKLSRSNAEVILSCGAVAIAHLETKLPIAFWADATYAAVQREYRWEIPAVTRSIRLGHAMEREGLKRATLAIFSSDWAAQSAINECGADPAKVKVVPYGANISTHYSAEQIDQIAGARPMDRCKLLFVGTGWERKGGDVALEVARLMNEAGLPTEVTLVGHIPESVKLPPFAKIAGYIDKKSPQGRAQFDAMFGAAHFLIHPARAEASAIVLCEAGAYGVPVLSTTAGGTPTLIKNNLNGLLFAPEDPASTANAAIELLRNRERYLALCASSFQESQNRLNWRVAGQAVRDLLAGVIRR